MTSSVRISIQSRSSAGYVTELHNQKVLYVATLRADLKSVLGVHESREALP
jgi:hypothetical protein